MKTLIVILVLFSGSAWAIKCPDKFSMEEWNSIKTVQDLSNMKETKAWQNLTANQKAVCQKEIDKAVEKRFGKDWKKRSQDSIDSIKNERKVKGFFSSIKSIIPAIFAILIILGIIRSFTQRK